MERYRDGRAVRQVGDPAPVWRAIDMPGRARCRPFTAPRLAVRADGGETNAPQATLQAKPQAQADPRRAAAGRRTARATERTARRRRAPSRAGSSGLRDRGSGPPSGGSRDSLTARTMARRATPRVHAARIDLCVRPVGALSLSRPRRRAARGSVPEPGLEGAVGDGPVRERGRQAGRERMGHQLRR